VIVIDEQTVITGSFNFTNSAEDKNAENLLVIKDKEIAMKYAENWNEHARHSPLHKGRPIQGLTK
jgi:phosphatidylserine/phosphatidylglycerophosphate/cardiolipin synthase-like enzyme